MKKLTETGLFCAYRNPFTKWMVAAPSILLLFLWCYSVFNGYRDIIQLKIPSATYCLYDDFLYYIARYGFFITLTVILLAALPFFLDKEANGDMILKSLPESRYKQAIARFIQIIVLNLTCLLAMLVTMMATICITDLLLPELSLSLYDRRLEFLEYGIRLILNMTAVVLIQTSAHIITKSVYMPVALGLLIALITDGIYNPFFSMLNCFIGNIPFL